MSYEQELPEERKIHNVFHVSNLKKIVGQHIAPSTELPPLDDEGLLVGEKGNSKTGWFESIWLSYQGTRTRG